MPIYMQTGSTIHDFWLVDGQKDFAIVQVEAVPFLSQPLPVWLKVGNAVFGSNHILQRHGKWALSHATSVPELVYKKLGQPGTIYTTEQDSKLKICIRISPEALLVLNLFDRVPVPHLSVTSLYAMPRSVDGERLGKYKGRPSQFQSVRV
jgi:hypothetical protein